MIIESLELDNFKSFGRKTKIVFRRGFTVITGPNGSGKSNIGDSLLFVLGNRSSKVVRADRLGDLIHSSEAGSERRHCSVTVTLLNGPEDGSPGERVVIRRELVRDQDGYKSNYYINGVHAKLSDLDALLSSLRIYLDSYSFVLQGDINNIVKMTGNERRKLIESISGIEAFDTQIQKAQTDMDRIADNLGKLEIIRQQDEIRKKQLEAEKQKAEEYNSLKERLTSLKHTLLYIEGEAIKRDLNSHTVQMGALQQEILDLEGQVSSLEKVIGQKNSEIAKLKEDLEASGNSELLKIRDRIQDLRLKVATEDMKISDGRDLVASLRNEIHETEDYVKKSRGRSEWIRSNITQSEEQLKLLREKISTVSNELQKLRNDSEFSSRRLIEKQRELKDLDLKISEVKAEIDRSGEDLNGIIQRLGELSVALGKLEEKKKQAEFQVRDAQWRLNEIQETDRSGSRNIQQLSQKYYDLKSRIGELRNEKEHLMKELNRLGKEQAELQGALSSRPGSRALSVIASARSSARIRGIIGPIKELITFDASFRSAVEAAAGSRLNAVVVQDDGVAEECLNLLKETKAGKLTFLPLNKLLPGRPRGKAITVRESEGSLGYVFENVKFDEKYLNAVWFAFQDTVIVRDIKTARKYMGGVRLVTLDGDIFEASGAITGGFQEKQKGSEDLDRRMAEIGSGIRELNDKLEAINSELPELEEEFDRIQEELRVTSKEEGSKTGEKSALLRSLEAGKQELQRVSSEISAIMDRIGSVEQEKQKVQAHIDSLRSETQRLEMEKEKVYSQIKDISPSYYSREQDMEAELENFRNKEKEFSGEISKLSAEDQFILEKVSEMERKISDLNRTLESKASEIREREISKSELESELRKLREMEEEIDRKTGEISRRIGEIEASIRSHEDQIANLRALQTTKREMIITLQAKIQMFSQRMEEIAEEMSAVCGTVISEIRSSHEAKRQISGVQASIEALGPVNQLAIQEYEEVSRDLSSLNEEIENLASERNALIKLLQELNDKKVSVFMDTFNGINNKMRSIYHELSGGGEAFLELSDPSKPLESEVYIKAKPKGTRFTKIEALSGGEKSLTALSFILAVQRTNPSSVYFLDEVDMFLDAANAERMARMFRANAETSQIIMVSLKQIVTRYANSLIGVTSQDGITSEVFERAVEEEAV